VIALAGRLAKSITSRSPVQAKPCNDANDRPVQGDERSMMSETIDVDTVDLAGGSNRVANPSEQERKSDLPSTLSAPARRALTAAGCTRLEDVAKLSEKEVKALHGVGPNAIEKLRRALSQSGRTFAGERPSS
jgi:hypothetical protein